MAISKKDKKQVKTQLAECLTPFKDSDMFEGRDINDVLNGVMSLFIKENNCRDKYINEHGSSVEIEMVDDNGVPYTFTQKL